MNPLPPEVRVFGDFAGQAAALFARWAQDAVAGGRLPAVALAGGQTPRDVYARLAAPPWRETIPWASLRFFQGDERPVGPDHPDSNWGMARRALLDRVAVRGEHLHRMIGEAADLDAAAAAYADILAEQLPASNGVPVFDLVLLGIGTDGHTASLFPGTPALHETCRSVVANPVAALGTTRLTLTLPVLNAAASVWFLVSGASKAGIVRRLLVDRDPELPASAVRPVTGRCLWLLDAAAAAGVPNPPQRY